MVRTSSPRLRLVGILVIIRGEARVVLGHRLVVGLRAFWPFLRDERRGRRLGAEGTLGLPES